MYQIYKPIGKTPKDMLPSDTQSCYAGRLDPMAHGYLLILTGDETKNMSSFKSKDKTYTIQVLVGVETDTTDCLGLVTNYSAQNLSSDKLLKAIDKYQGLTYDQEYHIYSSMTAKDVDGIKKPLWKIAKDSSLDNIVIPTKQVTIYSIKNILFEKVSASEVKKTMMSNISSLQSGNFRQEAIIKDWNTYFSNSEKMEYDVVTMTIHVSSGTYIRQLVKDISRDIGYPLNVYDLYREPFVLSSL